MSKKAEIKEETKKQLRALLLSAPKGLSGRDIQNDFKCMMGKTLPFRELGYSTAEDLFRDLPDVVRVTWVGGEVILRGISDRTTQHIERLVSRQKVSTKRRGTSKRGAPPRRYPAPRSNRPTVPPPTVSAFNRGQIRSLLLSYPNGLPAVHFEKAYARRFGNHIDCAKMGFKNLLELIKSLSDIVTIEESVRMGYMLHGRPPTQRQYSGDRPGEFQERRLVEQVCTLPRPAPSNNISNDSGVSDGLKRAIQKVLSRKPLGIRAALFPKEFKLVTGRELPVKELGYLSVIEMMDSLSDIVCIERPSPSDWLLFDARLYQVKYARTDVAGGGSVQSVPTSTAPPMDIFFKEMVRQVVEAYPRGLDSYQLTDAFEHLTDEPLNTMKHGFLSLDALIAQLNDVLVIEHTHEGLVTVKGKFLYSAVSCPQDCSKHFTLYSLADLFNRTPSRLLWEASNGRTVLHARDVSSSHRPNILKRQPEDLRVSAEVQVNRGRRGLPADTVGPGISYTPQSIQHGVGNVEVYVSNVINPSHFWLQLRGSDTTKALEELMDQLEYTYCGPQSEDYVVPDSLIMVGQVCVAIYPEDNNWHRVTITGIRDLDFVEVYYVDYGSTCSVSKQALRLIRSCYFTLPAQAIKARLANIQPADGTTWKPSLTGKLLQLVNGRPLWALTAHISEEQVVSVCLCDTSGDKDLHINDMLVQDGYAIYRQDDYYSLSPHLTHPHTAEPSSAADPQRHETSPQEAPHAGTESSRHDSETEHSSETGESEEKLDEDLVPRHVKFVQLTDDYNVHLVKFDDKLHMLSAEVSALLWQKDILHSMLWQKKMSVPRVVLTDKDHSEIFEELLEYEADGMMDGNEVKAQVTVYDLAGVLQILDIFEHESITLREALQLHLEQFSPDNPYWKGKADSDDEDDGDDSELGVSELEVALQALQFKRKRIIQEMLSVEASPTFVEKLENVEKQLTDVREKILEAQAIEKSAGGTGSWSSKLSPDEEMIQHCVGQQYKNYTSHMTTADKSLETCPKSGSSSPGKKTNMVAPMPAVATAPALQSSIMPTGDATKMTGAGFPMMDSLLPDSMAALTPSQQQMLAQYQLLLSQMTVVTNVLPTATGVPTFNFGLPQLNFRLPQSQMLSSTTLLCNTTMPTSVTNSQLGASSFDPSVLATMPALDTTTVLIGQGRGGALQRNINMVSPPGGLQKHNSPE